MYFLTITYFDCLHLLNNVFRVRWISSWFRTHQCSHIIINCISPCKFKVGVPKRFPWKVRRRRPSLLPHLHQPCYINWCHTHTCTVWVQQCTSYTYCSRSGAHDILCSQFARTERELSGKLHVHSRLKGGFVRTQRTLWLWAWTQRGPTIHAHM